jgi:putative ABC transport system substrate-binding protein
MEQRARSRERREHSFMRRKFFGFALSAMLFALCLRAEAQQPAKVFRIGYLAAGGSGPPQAFLQGLRDLGYVEGKNIIFEYRTPGENQDGPPISPLSS